LTRKETSNEHEEVSVQSIGGNGRVSIQAKGEVVEEHHNYEQK
jgi:hypothetical protein